MDFSTLDLRSIESSTDCISAYDEQLNITVWNGALERKYGIQAKDAIGKNLLDLYPHVKDDYRVRCIKEAMEVDKNFYFTGLPYVYEEGSYTQLILSFEDNQAGRFALNIVRDHSPNERVLRNDMIQPLIRK